MTTPLLETKLYTPTVRPDLVSRPRLVECLDAGLWRNGSTRGAFNDSPGFARKLTLVSAPAGFGKTTLLSEWVHRKGEGMDEASSSVQVAWLSLDKGDNDSVRFLSYLVAALQRIDEHIGAGTLSALQAPKPPPMEVLLTVLINQISAISDAFVLVLDDYHAITAQPVHDTIEFLLDHLPSNMHLVLATRSDPPLHLARLRGRGQLTELRAVDLRFTSDEVTQFLTQAVGMQLAEDDVAALASRTEGWIVGLQLAVISMQGSRDVSNFIRVFTGSHHFILDYLVEEVLQQQSEDIQTFLLRTAVLDRLAGPLCDFVTDQNNGQATLEALERANLFLVPLDGERRWYRYHHLFADLLRQRLRQSQPELVPALHGRASEWYEANGLMAEAIHHALSAHAFERAADLIERAAEATWMHSEVATFLSWLEALPDDMVHARPSLCVFNALALLMTGHPLEIVELHLRDAAEADPAGAVSGELALVRGLIAVYRGDTRRGTELSHRALENLPEESLFLRSLVAGILGLACLYSGDVVAATQALEEAARIGQQVGNLMNTVLALCHLAELCYLQGQLHEARAYYERALDLAVNGDGRRQPIACVALIGLGELLREWNDLESAMYHLVEGIELSKKCGEIWVISGYVVLAYIKQFQGDLEGAREAIQTAQQLAIRFDATEMDDLKVAVHHARLGLAQGNVEAAARWAGKRGLDTEASSDEFEQGSAVLFPPILREFEHITQARLYIARGEVNKALGVLRPLLRLVETAGWTRLAIEILILESLAFQAQGDLVRALTALRRALSLAEPGGFVRIFLDEGPPMAELLYQAAAHGILPEYTGTLLAAFDGSEYGSVPEESPHPRTQPLIEPLSERELDVLQLIAEGLSNQEVAQRLYLSLHTVKWHAGNIYGKLGVKNRTQAIAKARVLGIFPTP